MGEDFTKIKKFLEQLEFLLIRINGAELIGETYVEYAGKIRIIDSLILVNKKPLAVFEFKENLASLNNTQVTELLEALKVDCRYVVISNGVISKIIDTYSSKITSVNNATELVDVIFKEFSLEQVWQKKLMIIDELKKEFYTYKRELNGINNKLKNEILASKIQNITPALELFESDNFLENIEYDQDGQFYYLSGDIRDFHTLENSFFHRLVLDVDPGTKIYRYTTLDSVFKTIDNTKIRLSGIVGMNDISEVGYVDSYLDKKYIPMSNEIMVDSINRKFIMCSSILEDELMQWRLYGDDCKGACLVFNVIPNDELPGFLLRKINYGIQFNGKNFHPELELITRIKKRLRKNLGIEFKFKTLEIWKYFFKSFEYEPEKEVRLLLIGNKQNAIKGEKKLTGVGTPIELSWNLTSTHQILAPYLYLSIDDIRLRCKLEKVLLGAKCPELVLNLKQFKLLLNRKNLNHINVNPSKISNYR